MGIKYYEMSPGLHQMLDRFDCETLILMKQWLNKYFETGEEPRFTSIPLREIWFYCKIHELAYWVERKGHNWETTFEYAHLKKDLDRFSKKFENRKYIYI